MTITINNVTYTLEPEADLRRADLSWANLSGANLSWANLNGANLSESSLNGVNFDAANLNYANLSRANLNGANLSRANLTVANLNRANLVGANLNYADLGRADLSWADFTRANLSNTNLGAANLYGAVFKDTVLDPNNSPNADIRDFERCGKFVIGYRSRISGHLLEYKDGRIYTADWFSTCPTTDCHPGLYVWPELIMARDYSGKYSQLIKVYILPEDLHRTPNKWRCRMFQVIGKTF